MGNDLGRALQGAADAVNSAGPGTSQFPPPAPATIAPGPGLPFPQAWPGNMNPMQQAQQVPVQANTAQANTAQANTGGQDDWSWNKDGSWSWNNPSWGKDRSDAPWRKNDTKKKEDPNPTTSEDYLRPCLRCGKPAYLRNGLCLNEQCVAWTYPRKICRACSGYPEELEAPV